MNEEYEPCEGFKPIIDENSKILILGEIPSRISIENFKKTGNQDYYFNSSKNTFWKIIAETLNVNFDITSKSYVFRKNLLLSNKIAVWDIFKECYRRKDSSNNSKIDAKRIDYNDLIGNKKY